MAKKIACDVPRLFSLWNDQALTRTEIARALQLTDKQLDAMASRYGLARRGQRYRPPAASDPTPEEIAERAEWCRAQRAEAAQFDRVEIKAFAYDNHTGLFKGLDTWVA